jgi:hypothetical protein
MESSELLARAQAYAQSRGLIFDPQDTLGFGQDGSIWRTANRTAIKVFRRQQAYSTELACYERLRLHNVVRVGDFFVPGLIDSDDSLHVIEMDIVSPPYLLDFGKCYLDRKPDFSPEVWQQWQEDHEEMWEGRWKIVRRAVWQLEKYGIYHIDPHPGNLRFAE